MGIVEFLLLPVEVAECQQQHTFLYTAARGFLITFFIGGDGICGVFLRQVDIADGVVHLIQVVFVVVVGGHTLQSADHRLGIASCHHLRLCDTGIELQFVGRMTAYNLPERTLCFRPVSKLAFYLS